MKNLNKMSLIELTDVFKSKFHQEIQRNIDLYNRFLEIKDDQETEEREREITFNGLMEYYLAISPTFNMLLQESHKAILFREDINNLIEELKKTASELQESE